MQPISPSRAKQFSSSLLHWYQHDHYRPLPWKETKDPYKIWLSEVILQQTRVAQGLPYYHKFIQQYPTVQDLALAKDDDVFKLWQGLGYYNRCRNLLHTARYVHHQLNNIFPISYEALRALKGVGDYTAAAIASFAYGIPVAVVDGNVYRVLSRFFGIDTPIDSPVGKEKFQCLANQLLDKPNSALYNQAIMDFGATVCTPKGPSCEGCPLQKDCTAFHQQTTLQLPVKSKQISLKKRWFHYLIIKDQQDIWMQKRTQKDIWAGLYQPLLIETNKEEKDSTIKRTAQQIGITNIAFAGEAKQRLTHQLVSIKFYEGILLNEEHHLIKEGNFYKPNSLKNLALPRSLHLFFSKKKYL